LGNYWHIFHDAWTFEWVIFGLSQYCCLLNIYYWAKAYILWRKNTGAFVVASKETGLEVNADKTKYVIMSRDKNAGRSHSIKTDNSSFETVEEFRYLGTTLTNQHSSQEEIKSIMKSGNACYHSVQILVSSCLLSKYKQLRYTEL